MVSSIKDVRTFLPVFNPLPPLVYACPLFAYQLPPLSVRILSSEMIEELQKCEKVTAFDKYMHSVLIPCLALYFSILNDKRW